MIPGINISARGCGASQRLQPQLSQCLAGSQWRWLCVSVNPSCRACPMSAGLEWAGDPRDGLTPWQATSRPSGCWHCWKAGLRPQNSPVRYQPKPRAGKVRTQLLFQASGNRAQTSWMVGEAFA